MRLPELTPEQWDALRERDRRSELEARAVEAYNADVAGSTARERLDALIKWRNQTSAELAALQAQRERLRAMINEPEQVKGRKAGLIKTLAQRLLGGTDVEAFDVLECKTVDGEIAAARHRAAVAAVALVELDEKIDIQELRCKRLAERQHGFVRDALLETIASELGPKYRAAVDELRRVVQEIDAARRAGGMIGLNIVHHENRRQRVEHYFTLPDFGLLKGAENMVTSAGDAALASWRDLIKSWGTSATR